jgi:hypothetical protein
MELILPHYRFHKIPPLISFSCAVLHSILLTSFYITSILLLSSHSCLDISSGFSFCLPVNTLNASLCCLVRATCSAHFVLFDLSLITSALALCCFFQHYVTAVSWCTYIPQHMAPEHLVGRVHPITGHEGR